MDINKIVHKNGRIPLFDACSSWNKDLVKYIVRTWSKYN